MSKKLVACFSVSGVAAKVADMLADAIGADIYEIRPAIANGNAEVEQYDVIFLGFPIWWYVAPTIINTFLESYDFSCKKIILFATSGGSQFGNTVAELRRSVSDSCESIEGKLHTGRQAIPSIRSWTDTLDI